MKSLEEIHNYWKFFCNFGSSNLPEEYASELLNLRSTLIYGVLNRLVGKKSSILEIGCNVGRNLNHLLNNGYINLSGVEINSKAIDVMEEIYPDLYKILKIYNSPIEEVIKTFTDKQFDVVFTMAVLEHIHPDSSWVFKEIPRITNYLITIEDEIHSYDRVFQRNYFDIFSNLGMKQIIDVNLEDMLDNDLKNFK